MSSQRERPDAGNGEARVGDRYDSASVAQDGDEVNHPAAAAEAGKTPKAAAFTDDRQPLFNGDGKHYPTKQILLLAARENPPPLFDGRGNLLTDVEAQRALEQYVEYDRRKEALGEPTGLSEWDAGDDVDPPPPRGWLYGNIFARRFLSSLFADGGVGKTALRYAQLLSLATGRSLTGDHVFQRCRVLIVSLEDDADELRRRILALRLHYKIDRSEVKGWLFLSAPGAGGGKLMTVDKKGQLVRGSLAGNLEAVIVKRKIDIVSVDPFVKSHSVEENSNSLIDDVTQVLVDLSAKYNIAVDSPHHTSKGLADPGNADRGRGASAMKDSARLVYTLAPMSAEEANTLKIGEKERRLLIRMDSGKVNITPPLSEARWYRLVGVKLGNATDLYPNGDEVQAVEPWTPPDTWAGLSDELKERILTDIEAGLRDGDYYTDAPRANDRAAWKVITKYTDKSEAQAREIIKTWIEMEVLRVEEYKSPATSKMVKGLRVNPDDPF